MREELLCTIDDMKKGLATIKGIEEQLDKLLTQRRDEMASVADLVELILDRIQNTLK